jgi:hypothetical protein
MVITETEPKFNGYYRNRIVFLYVIVLTEVLKPYLPYNQINRTELTILTERAAGPETVDQRKNAFYQALQITARRRPKQHTHKYRINKIKQIEINIQ